MGIERGGGCPQNHPVKAEQNPGCGEESMASQGLQIWGDVKFREDAVVGAGVKGSVAGSGKVIVKDGAVISGSVEGTDVRVEGEAQGGVMAKGQVWIGPKAKVKVRCSGRAVRIEPGAEFRGELQVG